MTTKLGRAVDLSTADGTCRRIHEIDDSKLVGVPVAVAGDAVVGHEMAAVAVEVKTDVKRKRGRPPRGQGKLPPAKKQKEKEDEDVCFICFDGGSLVVCDRRSCPKAYHPACIKRDEAFFQSKAKWTCGWHICSVCEKPAHYMCYTCTYSLCKGCTKDADYVCVRGDKGFCVTCMKTIMLIEDEELRNKEMAGLDFDDASSWEYLFKIYWVYLKGNLSLTNKELAEAKSPWKESGAMAYKGQSSNIRGEANSFKRVLDMSTGQLKGNDSINTESNESLKRLNEDSVSTQKESNEKGTSSVVTTKWATEELLDFVAYMKNGDMCVLSQSDVQTLVLDYVRVNNLCDPHQESHFVCDSRLETLFGKRRVGHSELLKLLDCHFLVKGESVDNVVVQGGVDVNANQVLSEPSNNNLIAKDKKPKTHRKGKVCGPQANSNEYAMIDVPTISLIYLRRNLMEKLIKVKDKFQEMVVGSVVRIRIAGGEQKQDMYRLVQVVGTIKVSEPYKVNDTAADVMLEVLNLDKREVVSIAAISNQDVSEDDCRRLRQSIKCRLVKCFTVGEILEKAKLLQAIRLNDSLEAEMSRLNHLRNQAIEKGCKKELIECVEKLHILKTPEERQRRLTQILEVRSDPTMDPNYESEEDAGERDNGKKSHQVKPSNSKYNTEVNEPGSLKKGDTSDDNDSRPSSPSCEQSRNLCAASYPDKEESAAKALQRLSEGKDAWRPNSLERVGGNGQTVASSPTVSIISSEMSTASLPVGNIPFAYNGETMLWHYEDPNGKVQGPFCMLQLQQWSTTGYFPLDMRIWANDKQDNSILLSDALSGHIEKAFPWLNNISSQVQVVGGTSDSKSFNANFEWNENTNTTKDGRQTEGNWCGNIATVNFNSKTDIATGRLDTQSSVWTAPIVSCSKDMTAVSCSQDHDSFKGNGSGHKLLQAHSPLSPSTLNVKDYVNHQHEINYEGKKGNSDSGHENMGSHGTTISNSTARHMLGNHYHSQSFPSQSSVKNSSPPVNFSSKNLDLNSTFSPTKSTDSPDQSGEVNIMNFNSPSQKAGYVDCEYEVTENKESVSSSVHFHDPGALKLASPSPKINGEYQKGLSVEKKQSASSKISFQDSGPSWSSTSNITVGRQQLPDISDVWGGYTSAPVKHSLEWDSNLISVSSLLHDHVGTANTRNGELTHFNLSHPPSSISGWHSTASGPIEFDTLAEESVSDLLAEVDAMESQCGLPSPTSMRNNGEDLINLNLEMA